MIENIANRLEWESSCAFAMSKGAHADDIEDSAFAAGQAHAYRNAARIVREIALAAAEKEPS